MVHFSKSLHIDPKKDFKVEKATIHDSPFITEGIIHGFGEDLCRGFVKNNHVYDDVKTAFRTLVEMPNSQFSYLNTIVAKSTTKEVMGILVGFDGKDYQQLHQPFIQVFKDHLDINLNDLFEDEASPDEFYLDTIMVFPKFRGLGIASQLIDRFLIQARNKGKPTSLVVRESNSTAIKLYQKHGFEFVSKKLVGGEIEHYMRAA